MGSAGMERELVNAFIAAGVYAQRTPSSGSATTRDLPDVLALAPWGKIINSYALASLLAGENNSQTLPAYGFPQPIRALFIESKATSRDHAYYDESEVDALTRAAKTGNGKPLLAARFKDAATNGRAHYLLQPSDARQLDSGRYAISQSDAPTDAFVAVDAAAEQVDWNPGPTVEVDQS